MMHIVRCTSIDIERSVLHAGGLCTQTGTDPDRVLHHNRPGGGICEVPEGLKLYTFPESDWAMFSAKGSLPNSLQSLNDRVWKEWYPGEGQKYQCNGNAMLEVYAAGDMQSPDYECGIWIPLQEKV